MPIYRYQAHRSEGKKIRSIIEAGSLTEAEEKLFRSNLSPTVVKEKKIHENLFLPREDLLTFTRQLAQLLEADLPLYESLALLKKQTEKKNLSAVLTVLYEGLKEGKSFSSVLKCYPFCFDTLYHTMVHIGEAGGYLGRSLRYLSEEYDNRYRLRKRIVSSLLYPSLLALLSLLLLGILFFYVVPSLEPLFGGEHLHPLTKTVLHISKHLRSLWLMDFSYGIGLFLFFFILKKKISRWPEYRDSLILKIRSLNTFVIEFSLAGFSSATGMLLEGGVPLLDSLKLAYPLLINTILKKAFRRIIEKVEEGRPISGEIEKHRFFPPLFGQMILVGERSGEMTKCFKHLAAIYEDRTRKKLAQYTALLSPVLLLGMGILIGAIMLAVLIPLTDIRSIDI